MKNIKYIENKQKTKSIFATFFNALYKRDQKHGKVRQATHERKLFSR